MQKTKSILPDIYIHEIILNNDKYQLNIHLKHFNLEEIRQGSRAARPQYMIFWYSHNVFQVLLV